MLYKSPIYCFIREYSFLSNYFASPIVVDGVKWQTVEHAYHALKAQIGSDEYEAIFEAETPGEAKKIGRKIKLDSDWKENKITVMEKLLRLKFEQHPDLREKLINSYPAQLEEGNNWGDRFWGVCPARVDGETNDKSKGENHLGKLLMMIRAEYIENPD